jgi:hypothetical protein
VYTTQLYWNFPTDWKFIDGYDYPVLSWQDSPPVRPAGTATF